MTNRPLWRAISFCACLLFALPAWSADDADAEPPPSSSSTAATAVGAAPGDGADAVSAAAARAEGKALIERGRFAEALIILAPLVRDGEAQPNDLFLFGLAAVGAAQQPEVGEDDREALLDSAIAVFRTMLIDRPSLVRVRLELARAFFLKGEDDLARRNFEQVLAGDPPEAVAANVQGFLNRIRARRRWSVNAGFALAPDSNIGASSEERIIYIFNLPFRRDAEELTTSGIGVSVWGGAEYQYPFAESLRLRAGAEAARREYERSDFDQFFLSGHVGPRWLVDGSTEGSLLLSARQRWLGTAPDHHDLGARLEAGRRLGRSVTVSGQASWHERRYRTRDHLDGPVTDVAVRGAWTVTPTVRAELSGGYGKERPEAESQRNESHWVGTRLTLILPWGFTVGAGGEVRWAEYEGRWFPFVRDGSPREDRTRSVRASVHNRGVTLLGFSPELIVVNEERETNAQLYDYERTRGELRFVRQF